MSQITLVTGGTRSGKSRHALTLAAKYNRKAFVATAVASDDEMSERIDKHRQERGEGFITIEEPTDLVAALKRIPAECEAAVIDCLTVWQGNLMHKHGEVTEPPEMSRFLDALSEPPCDLIIVTNEVGMGIVPPSSAGREFRDRAGRYNQAVAKIADTVVLLVSGIAMTIKGRTED